MADENDIPSGGSAGNGDPQHKIAERLDPATLHARMMAWSGPVPEPLEDERPDLWWRRVAEGMLTAAPAAGDPSRTVIWSFQQELEKRRAHQPRLEGFAIGWGERLAGDVLAPRVDLPDPITTDDGRLEVAYRADGDWIRITAEAIGEGGAACYTNRELQIVVGDIEDPLGNATAKLCFNDQGFAETALFDDGVVRGFLRRVTLVEIAEE